MSRISIIAHRGASGTAPENTLAAINMALDIGADGIEIDVHQSKDGKVVVIHDAELERTTGKEGFVGDLKYNELKELDAGSWFSPDFKQEKIPLLEDVISAIKGKASLIIEVKDGSSIYPDIEKNIWEIVKKHNTTGETVISSSRVTVLNNFKKIAPEARLAKIISPAELWRSLFQPNSFIMKQSLFSHIKELHPHWSFIDRPLMQWADEHNLKVIPWTVNKERKIFAMMDRYVDGVITDFPETAKKAVRDHG